MLKKRSVLLVKEESSYGVDSSPAASQNAILAIDLKIKETPAAEERDVEKATLGRKASLLGKIMTEISFTIEMAGSGSAGTAPRVGDLLEACGFVETVSAGASVSYAPGSASFKSATVYAYVDGRLHKVTGARGNVKPKVAAGKPGTFEFTLQGLYNAPTDTAVPAATYESTTPPVAKGCSVSLNAVTSLIVQQVEIDLGTQLAMRESLAAATGYAGVEITGRKPSVSLNPEAVSISTYDFRADLLATPRALSVGPIGSTAGNKITITAPKVNTVGFEYADRDGVLVENIKGELAENTGNDELVITFA